MRPTVLKCSLNSSSLWQFVVNLRFYRCCRTNECYVTCTILTKKKKSLGSGSNWRLQQTTELQSCRCHPNRDPELHWRHTFNLTLAWRLCCLPPFLCSSCFSFFIGGPRRITTVFPCLSHPFYLLNFRKSATTATKNNLVTVTSKSVRSPRPQTQQ